MVKFSIVWIIRLNFNLLHEVKQNTLQDLFSKPSLTTDYNRADNIVDTSFIILLCSLLASCRVFVSRWHMEQKPNGSELRWGFLFANVLAFAFFIPDNCISALDSNKKLCFTAPSLLHWSNRICHPRIKGRLLKYYSCAPPEKLREDKWASKYWAVSWISLF